jgi:hypothetical protein
MAFKIFRYSLLLAASSLALGALAQTYEDHKIVDTKGTGGTALTLNVPQGWKVLDSIFWNLNIRMNPMSYFYTAGTPDGSEFVTYLSGLSFDFATTPYGGTVGKPPPARPSDYLLEIAKSASIRKDVQVVDQQDTPIPYNLQSLNPNLHVQAYHSTLKIKFTANGVAKEEESSADTYVYNRVFGPNNSNGNWMIVGKKTFTALEGHLQTLMPTFTHILDSERMDPQFFATWKQVGDMLLARTRAEQAAAVQHAQTFISSGGSTTKVFDKDTFMLHEEIRGLKSQLFSRSIGN